MNFFIHLKNIIYFFYFFIIIFCLSILSFLNKLEAFSLQFDHIKKTKQIAQKQNLITKIHIKKNQ